MNPHPGVTRLPALVMAMAASLGAVLAGGCSSSLPASVSKAPVLSVVTGLWPLAQAATEIGGGKVAVDDLVPPGADPLTFRPDAGGTDVLRSAGLVLLAGGGLQPDLGRAAAGAVHVIRLAEALGTANPYVWLDPATMRRAVGVMADAMAAANPPAAALYKRNAAGLRSEIGSLDIDFSSTLSTCQGTTMVVPDRAFTTMASHYGLTGLVAPPDVSAPTVQAYRTRLAADRARAAYSQPWVDDRGVEAVAAAAGIRVRPLDTLAGAPQGGTPAQNTYLNRMEEVLANLSGPLACDTGSQ